MHSSGFHLGRFVRNAAIVAAVAGGGAGLWFGYVRDRVVAKRFGEVTPTLYRSGQMSEHVVGRVLADYGIKQIIDLTEPEFTPRGKLREEEIARASGIEVLHFPLIGDGTGDVSVYTSAVAALIRSDRSGEPTLVHCSAGTQRTGGVVAAFRMLHQGWTPEAALDEARRYDWRDTDVEMSRYLFEHLDEIRASLIASGDLAPDAPRPVVSPELARTFARGER